LQPPPQQQQAKTALEPGQQAAPGFLDRPVVDAGQESPDLRDGLKMVVVHDGVYPLIMNKTWLAVQAHRALETNTRLRLVLYWKRLANITHTQQANNAPTDPRARENNFQQTQLLETTDGGRLDFGAAATASGRHRQS